MVLNGLALAIVAPVPAVAVADAAARWELVREREMCVLRKVFAHDGDRITVAIRANPVGSLTSLFLGRKGRGERAALKAQVGVADAEPTEATAIRYPLASGAREGLAMTTGAIEPEALARRPLLTVRVDQDPALAFDMAGAAEA